MKITISSPDGLGDFVLRVPMVRAMLDGGHRLQVFMRRPALELAAEIFPEAEILEIAADPYHPATAGKLTKTAPSTGGQYVAPVGNALSTTILSINPQPTVLL